MKRFPAVAVLIVLLFVSCVTQPISGDRNWLSFMGSDGRAVIVADKSVTGIGEVFAESGKDGRLCGVAKLGDIPAFAIHRALDSNKALEKNKVGALTVYTSSDSGICLACVGRGLVFFSNGDIASDFERLSTATEPVLDDNTVLELLSGACSLYISDADFLNLGNLTGFESMTAVSSDGVTFDAGFAFETETQCGAFEKIFKAKLVSDSLKDGVKPDLQALAAKVSRNANHLTLKGVLATDYVLPDYIEMLSSFNTVF